MKQLLANRNFMAVWAASFVSGLGDKIAILAFFSLVYNRTGNVASLGLLAAVQVLPGVVLGPFAGVLIDRWSRRGVMVASDLLSVATVCVIPLVDSLALVYVLAAVLAAGRHLSGPARLALIPDLVPNDQLNRGNALFMVSQNVILLVGMAAGGVIVAGLGTAVAFWVDGGTFAASALLLLLPRLQEPAACDGEAAARSRWHDVRHGAVWLWGRPRLRYAVLFLALVTMITAMQPPLVYEFITRLLGRSERELGLIFATAGLGGLLGAGIASVFRSLHHPLRTVGWLVAIDGALLTLFALNRNLAVALLLFALFGAISTGIQVNLATFLQRETPPEKRGRVFGWLSPLLGPVTLLSVLAGPVVAGWAGVVAVLAVAGACEVLLGVAGALSAPRPDRRSEEAMAGNPADGEAGEGEDDLKAMAGRA
ncbi:MFS transporter [bacterium]|nr:MFS transporter [bacterium]MBU1072815.1 MFS transporter [bacterium]MBU1676527.1 MFS transporter [bacterium]